MKYLNYQSVGWKQDLEMRLKRFLKKNEAQMKLRDKQIMLSFINNHHPTS